MGRHKTHRSDNNQKQIQKLLSAYKVGFKDVSNVSEFCDLVVMFRGEIYFFEIKNPDYVKKPENYKKSLTDGERKFHSYCSIFNVEVHIVTRIKEILEIIGLK